MSTGRTITTHRLDNGLDIHFVDQSRQIAADRWYVCVRVQMSIPIEKRWFEHHPVDDREFQHIRQTLGDSVLFEQKKERNFISDDEKNAIIDAICSNTMKTAKHYLGHGDFATKYILKQYREKLRLF